MSGVTKHIYEHEIRDIVSMWSEQLKAVQNVLPQYYTEDDIINALKHFYPHEWRSVEIKYWYYQRKDRGLKKRLGKARYNMKAPIKILAGIFLYKKCFLQNSGRNMLIISMLKTERMQKKVYGISENQR